MTSTFRDFVASKPADEAYIFLDNYNCPYAQFLKATGQATNPSVGGWDWYERYDNHIGAKIPEELTGPREGSEKSILASRPQTFGAMLQRLDQL